MNDELKDEYRFDYRHAKRNRFAVAMPPGGRVVYLEPEVASKFSDSDSVNRILRALLEAMPPASGSLEQSATAAGPKT